MGRQDAAGNTAYYVPQIADERVVPQRERVEYYEIWHLKQAEDFQNYGWMITNENYNEYLKTLREKCRFRLDSGGIDEYNVGK